MTGYLLALDNQGVTLFNLLPAYASSMQMTRQLLQPSGNIHNSRAEHKPQAREGKKSRQNPPAAHSKASDPNTIVAKQHKGD